MRGRFGPARQRPGADLFICTRFLGGQKTLQRTYSLKKNAQFKYVYRRGTSGGSHEMVMLYARSNSLKVGFSVGKKLGCAVVRNRIKRRLRAACAPLLPQMKPGLYVFIARQSAATADFDKLCRSMQYLLRKQNRLVTGPKTGQDEQTAKKEAVVKKAGDPA
ncbi:MAG: ribonuclease P protein component [Clostridiales bacterium]|nr:ribonuclease P protein component [Clostridiales bacterium]